MSKVMSRVYNPTPYQVVGQFDGISYMFESGTSKMLPDEVAWWILQKKAMDGLVCIDPPDDETGQSKTKYKVFVVKKALEGLQAYLDTLHNAIESFFTLDTELKQHNQHGTVLKCKAVRELTEKVEVVTHLIGDIEKKHGVSIAKEDYKAKALSVMSSIEDTITAFEEDEAAQAEAAKEEKKMDSIVRDIQKGIIPSNPS